ncbi:MAG: rhodanese-like domain-containing protein [candidate division Zixibacteria bacterium]|nr:rhodanese-like domain-containing protein [candidate division Zixibacteria bacterium]
MSSESPVPSITVQELRQKEMAGERFFLLDVRTEGEFVAGHLGFTSALVPHGTLPEHLDKLPSDKEMPIYNFCRSGRRSAGTTQYLRSLGYVRAYNVTGGILAWVRAGYEITSGVGGHW